MNRIRKTVGPSALCTLALAASCGFGELSMDCTPYATAEQLAERPSPFDSVEVTVGAARAKICYSRPSARGRVVFGGELVPWDVLWRTGANEPTLIYLDHDAEIAGMSVPAGKYSLYTVPNPDQWLVVVNASTDQWGQTRDMVTPDGTQSENAYTAEVQEQEVGRASISTEQIDYVEQFTARFGPATADGADVWFEWETTRIIVPLRFKGGQ